MAPSQDELNRVALAAIDIVEQAKVKFPDCNDAYLKFGLKLVAIEMYSKGYEDGLKQKINETSNENQSIDHKENIESERMPSQVLS